MLFTTSNSTACWFDWSGAEESWRVLCRCVVWRRGLHTRDVVCCARKTVYIGIVINASFCFLQCIIGSHQASSSSPLFICAESIIGCILSFGSFKYIPSFSKFWISGSLWYALSTKHSKWKFTGTGSMVEYPFALDVHSAFLMRTIYDGRMCDKN